MAALDFPNTPTLNQQYAAPNGVTYQWDGAAWIVTGGPPGQLWTASGATLLPTDPTKLYLQVGNASTKARFLSESTGTVEMSINRTPADGQDDATKPSWFTACDPAGDLFTVYRKPPAGAWATLARVDNGGSLTLNVASPASTNATAGVFRATGNGGGLKCQNIGTIGGDTYSNTIGFGWDGAHVYVRVDTTNNGYITLTPSDGRLKTKVEEDCPGLDAVLKLRPISFEFTKPGTQDEPGPPRGRHYGIIAQEAREHVPYAVEEDYTEEKMLTLEYHQLVPVLIRAIQELAAERASADA
jgi:hypothetical protein